MRYVELMKKIREIIPTAAFGEDDDGQIIIYTDLAEMPDEDELVPFDGPAIEGVKLSRWW